MGSNVYYQIVGEPSWQSDKAIAFDLYLGYEGRERVFIPRSQVMERDGAQWVSSWIYDRKVEELADKHGLGIDAVHTEMAAIADRSLFLNPGPRPQRRHPGVEAGNLLALFDRAAERLKHPVLRTYAYDERYPDDRVLVRLRRAGDKARTPGVVYLDDGSPYDSYSKRFYGTVHRDGRFVPAKDCPPEVIALVQKLDQDPEAELRSYGHAVGQCSCCGRKLTDPTSVEFGIGPICRAEWF